MSIICRDWDKFANTLANELGENLIEEGAGEEDPYNWYLSDLTVSDFVEFVKKHRSLIPNSDNDIGVKEK
jgi:hypothetical protein